MLTPSIRQCAQTAWMCYSGQALEQDKELKYLLAVAVVVACLPRPSFLLPSANTCSTARQDVDSPPAIHTSVAQLKQWSFM